MAEYIRKEDAVNALDRIFDNVPMELTTEILRLRRELRGLPSADVAPVVHSQWKYKCGEIQCPECGNRIHRIDLSGYLNFCPNCGAKMDK